ncbi:MAG: STAS domain-containing protein, partial [Thermodesulfobacteriota bacterium]
AILNLSAKGGLNVVLDFSQVKVIDSMGIGVVVACLKTLKQRGGDLRVATQDKDLIKLFSVLKLDYILIREIS